MPHQLLLPTYYKRTNLRLLSPLLPLLNLWEGNGMSLGWREGVWSRSRGLWRHGPLFRDSPRNGARKDGLGAWRSWHLSILNRNQRGRKRMVQPRSNRRLGWGGQWARSASRRISLCEDDRVRSSRPILERRFSLETTSDLLPDLANTGQTMKIGRRWEDSRRLFWRDMEALDCCSLGRHWSPMSNWERRRKCAYKRSRKSSPTIRRKGSYFMRLRTRRRKRIPCRPRDEIFHLCVVQRSQTSAKPFEDKSASSSQMLETPAHQRRIHIHGGMFC